MRILRRRGGSLMRIPRGVSSTIGYLLDNIIPPALRDAKWFMTPMMRLVLGPKYKAYMGFKKNLAHMTNAQIDSLYESLADTFIERDTDLNQESVSFILKNIVGESVIDVGCGRGYLTRAIRAEFEKEALSVSGFDVAVNPGFRDGVTYEKGTVLRLPYEDNAFDTVVCCHVLEHILKIDSALKELKRIAAKRLIIVVPRQREYRYTFDLHIHFFPYMFDFERLVGSKSAKFYKMGKDMLCIDDM